MSAPLATSHRRLRFRRRELIGGGGGGEVHRARLGWPGWWGREVAVKTLSREQSRDGELVRRLHTEAAALAVLDHDNIVRLEGITRTLQGRLALVMEYVDGLSLAELVRGTALTLEASLYVGRCLLRALAHGDQHGLVHRDLSLRNVLVSWTGDVKLADYGLARPVGTAPTDAHHIDCTLPYLSPEQANGQPADGRSDLFALGVLLYRLITGQVPVRGTTRHEVIGELINWQGPRWDLLPPRLAPLLARMLARERADRYRGAEEALSVWPEAPKGFDDLLAALDARKGPQGGEGRRGLRVALAVGALALIGAGVAGWHAQGDEPASSITSVVESKVATPIAVPLVVSRRDDRDADQVAAHDPPAPTVESPVTSVARRAKDRSPRGPGKRLGSGEKGPPSPRDNALDRAVTTTGGAPEDGAQAGSGAAGRAAADAIPNWTSHELETLYVSSDRSGTMD